MERRRGRSLPTLPKELIEEIFLRISPDEPACLFRASLTSKRWSKVVSSRRFRERLLALHRTRTPPMLGVLHGNNWDNIPRFIHTTASPFSLVGAPDYRSWRALDSRHGRALFLSEGQVPVVVRLLIWEPITRTQQRVPVPVPEAYRRGSSNAAVFCAADGCDHRDCLGGPFRVAFVFGLMDKRGLLTSSTTAMAYSSETGTWGEPIVLHGLLGWYSSYTSSVLVGRSLLYFMQGMSEGNILEYDVARHSLASIDLPEFELERNLMLTVDGGLGVISESEKKELKVWSWQEAIDGSDTYSPEEASDGSDTDSSEEAIDGSDTDSSEEASDGRHKGWVLSRVICLDKLLPNGALQEPVVVLGFAEGANVIFVLTDAGVFTIDLQSEVVRKVTGQFTINDGLSNLLPVVSFYTPVPRGLHHGPPSSNLGEDRAGEEQKVAEQVHQLFDKGSNASKEGEFVSAGISHTIDLETRSAPNEESVKGTTSKDDAGNSKTSDSSVEDAAPLWEEGDSQEGIYQSIAICSSKGHLPR
ncbi:uncharacterized protein LOC112268537 [Brachypodium distachyon]|uniref:F-box domain-containing protein n=1 Tax=Brachypodium distachyon TaxID=15368 RepID=A0A2K2DI15_BRADI|nr:uncharacterized protein LOC112268537 [Brachypodium distachyon]PNT73924.1 hypothetical protein BRADI_1g04286v3 [Brachypodium distachyon]PNT73925.1 hypothetical protein BRADI_1g04286v3 [Brachypodium distachyon]PNT73926.1 hypothetical protein BRADI_1g04286v3 [Brachypodium distachyon]|eukprot:XP_024316744.1 uncharacterized protein LOC112268537 [Brachypodium distachyon]